MVCPLKWLRLPVGGQVGHHPVANFGIARVQRSGLGGETGLRPVHPETEFQPVLVGIVGDDGQTVREFLRIGIPVAHAAKPAGIDVKHVHSQFGRVANHAQRDLFVDVHATAPTVVDHQRIVRDSSRFQGCRERRAPSAAGHFPRHPHHRGKPPRNTTGVSKTSPGARDVCGMERDRGSVRRRPGKGILFPSHRDSGTAAELDAGVPSGLGCIFALVR